MGSMHIKIYDIKVDKLKAIKSRNWVFFIAFFYAMKND